MSCVSTTTPATSAVVYVSYRQSSSRHVLVVATPPLSRGSSAGRLLLLRSSKNKIKCLKGHSGGTAAARHIQLPHIVIDLTLWGDHYQQKVIFETAFNPRASSGPKCPPPHHHHLHLSFHSPFNLRRAPLFIPRAGVVKGRQHSAQRNRSRFIQSWFRVAPGLHRTAPPPGKLL